MAKKQSKSIRTTTWQLAVRFSERYRELLDSIASYHGVPGIVDAVRIALRNESRLVVEGESVYMPDNDSEPYDTLWTCRMHDAARKDLRAVEKCHGIGPSEAARFVIRAEAARVAEAKRR
jgi:hypothetical protein